jgi:flagellar biosynthesis chaperone FliJ
MNITEVRNVIRQVIAEAKAEGKLPNSGGKLVHLKKELTGLKKMKESLGSYTINEGGDGQFVAEYAHMQKFVNELEKIKVAHARLSEMLDNQISEVEGKVSRETEKIKEMMGLIEKAKAPKEKKEKKADKSTAKSKHEKGETKAEEKAEHKPEAKKAPAKKEDLNESEFTYRKINGVCYKIDDENNRTKVSSQYCN